MSHAEAVELQERTRDRVLANEPASTLLLCEHHPVVTLGRGASLENVRSSTAAMEAAGVEVRRASRGGDVTFHGPGQLMVYPVVRLRTGIVAYLESIATALGAVAATYGVTGARWRRDPAGLWIESRKLAACGVHLRRRVAIHGFALNVSTPESAWRHIVPCGLADYGVTSMARERRERGLGAAPRVAEVAETAAPLLVAALDSVRQRALPSSEPDRAEVH